MIFEVDKVALRQVFFSIHAPYQLYQCSILRNPPLRCIQTAYHRLDTQLDASPLIWLLAGFIVVKLTNEPQYLFQIETGFQEQGLHLKIGFPQEGKGSNFNVSSVSCSV
jgi:hypothetical protein